jgi:hypothetical protein
VRGLRRRPRRVACPATSLLFEVFCASLDLPSVRRTCDLGSCELSCDPCGIQNGSMSDIAISQQLAFQYHRVSLEIDCLLLG